MDTPQLKVLMGSYYHQDWVEVGLWETVDEYISDADEQERSQLLHDIEDVLAQVPSTELGQVVRSLGAYVDLDDEPGGYRGWLEETARRVAAGAPQRRCSLTTPKLGR